MVHVVIADDRKPWMIEEDKRAVCACCSLLKKCVSRIGNDCKKRGGNIIPKIRSEKLGKTRNNSKSHSSFR